jgi:hypothetical protein
MNNTFIRKVNAERKVLAVINSSTPGSRQLTGLSAGAIEAWRRTAGLENVDEVAESLRRIAGLCQRLSDRSHESFQSLDPMLMEKINAELCDLQQSLDLWNPLTGS